MKSFWKWLSENASQDPMYAQELKQLVARFDKEYPRASSVLNGIQVRTDVPNTSSISASLSDYYILPGIRSFSIHGFGGASSYYSASDQNRVHKLAQQIQESKSLNPLIMIEEKNGPYVLEGGHRISAMVELKATVVPALIVLDLESLMPDWT